MGYGAASGFVTGALVGAIGAVRYNISDEYAWGVDKQILEYSDELTSSGIGDQEARKKMARYVAPSVVLFEKHLFSSIIFGADIF